MFGSNLYEIDSMESYLSFAATFVSHMTISTEISKFALLDSWYLYFGHKIDLNLQ